MQSSREYLELKKVNFGNISKLHQHAHTKKIWECDELEKLNQRVVDGGIIEWEEWQKFRGVLLDLLYKADENERLKNWQELNDKIDHLFPIAEIVVQDEVVLQEMYRCRNYLLDNIEFSYVVSGLESKLLAFLLDNYPTSTRAESRLPNQSQPTQYSSRRKWNLPIKSASKIPSDKIMPDNIIEWFVDKHKGSLFNPKTINTNITIRPKKIHFKDFLRSIGTVAEESIVCESAFKTPLENLVRTFNVDLTSYKIRDLRNTDDFEDLDYEESTQELTAGEQTVDISLELDLSAITKQKKRLTREEMVKMLPKPKTGREAVVYLIKCSHLGEMKVLYFKYKSQRIKDFYELTRITKFQLQGEYFIFSSVGIIHHNEDNSGVALSLTDWYRDSILYYALKQYPFIRNYLVNKYFKSWKMWSIKRRHKQVRIVLEKQLLTANEIYGKSLMQIVKLLNEISQISLIPESFHYQQTEESFLNLIFNFQMKANQYLERFYKYVKLVVDETAAEMYKKLQFSQSQINQKNIYSNDPVSLANEKQRERENQLKIAMKQVYQLGIFVKLVNYLLNDRIVSMSLHNIDKCVKLLIWQDELSEIKLSDINKVQFTTIVHIDMGNGQNALVIDPTCDLIERLFENTIGNIPKEILRYCYPFDGLLSSKYLKRFQAKIHKQMVTSAGKRSDTRITSSSRQYRQSLLDYYAEDYDNESIDLPNIDLPTKSENDRLVATPLNVNRNILQNDSLVIFGKSIPSKFSPISSQNVFELLEINPQFIWLNEQLKTVFSESHDEIHFIFQDYDWLVDIREEYLNWKRLSAQEEWINETPINLEKRVILIKSYASRLKSIEYQLVLRTQILLLDFESLIEELFNEMSFELEQIFSFMLSRVQDQGGIFIADISHCLEILKLRDTSIESFIKVSIHVGKCRESSPKYQKQMDYLKSLFDVLRLTQMPIDERYRQMEDSVMFLWDSFMFQLEEANNFISNDKSVQVLAIKARLLELENDAKNLQSSLGDCKFTKTTDNIQIVLSEIHDKQRQLNELTEEIQFLLDSYKLLTNGEIYKFNLDLTQIQSDIEDLQILWQMYLDVELGLSQWNNSLFCQFNVEEASQKISLWQNQLQEFQSKQDLHQQAILTYLVDCLNHFGSHLHLFLKLADATFTMDDWKQLFLEIGEEFVDPINQLTVKHLIDINILNYPNIVDIIYNNAVVTAKTLKDIDDLYRFWLTRQFDMDEHVPDSWYKQQWEEKSRTNARQRTPAENLIRSRAEIFYETKKEQENDQRKSTLPITDNSKRQGHQLMLVGHLDKLRIEIFDCQIALQRQSNKKQSPSNTSVSNTNGHNTDQSVELKLNSCLGDLELFIDCLSTCQIKWSFLERVFEEEVYVATYHELAQQFSSANEKFLSITSGIYNCPLVLNYTVRGYYFLQDKPSSSKYTEYYGELSQLSVLFQEIINQLTGIFDNCRKLFPRLYFVSNDALVKLMSCQLSQNMENIQFIVDKCFNNIAQLVFNEENNETSSFVSNFTEKIYLIDAIPHLNVPTKWLKLFERSVRSTIKESIGKCVLEQMTLFNNSREEEPAEEFSSTMLFQELSKLSETIQQKVPTDKQEAAQKLMTNILSTYNNWLKKYPLQVLIISEKISFNRLFQQMIAANQTIQELQKTLKDNQSNLFSLMKFINITDDANFSKSMVALEKLILLSNYHMHVVNEYINQEIQGVNSFQYLSRIKYNLDINNQLEVPIGHDPEIGDVQIELFQYRLLYEYEYSDYHEFFPLDPIEESSCVNMLLALTNNQVSCIEQTTSSSLILPTRELAMICGRYYAELDCTNPQDIHIDLIRRYLIGSLLSGSILCVSQMDQLPCELMSMLACDLRKIKQFLDHVDVLERRKSIKSRRSSSPPRPTDSKKKKKSKFQFNQISEDTTIDEIEVTKSDYYELQNLKLDKGVSCPYFMSKRSILHSSQSNRGAKYPRYNPWILGQLDFQQQLLEVRYGYGMITTMTSQHLAENFMKVPATLKTQLRFHRPIRPDQSIDIQVELMLCQSEHLQEAITSFLRDIHGYFPQLYNTCCELLTKSLRYWKYYYFNRADYQSCSELEKYGLFNRLLQRKMTVHLYNVEPLLIQNNDLLNKLLSLHFPVNIDKEQERQTNLDHEIKLQYRLHNIDYSDEDINQIVELKTCVDTHQLIWLVGSNKSTNVEILAAAINNYSNSRGITSARSEKLRVLKSLPRNTGAVDIIAVVPRIKLRKISLDNFHISELRHLSIVNGKESISALLSILQSDLEMSYQSNYQIWFLIEASSRSVAEILSAVKPLYKSIVNKPDNVKIILEWKRPVQHFSGEVIPQDCGVFHMSNQSNQWQVYIALQSSELLKNEMLTYHGSKLLGKVSLAIFTELFEAFKSSLSITGNNRLEMVFVQHYFEIIKSVLLDDQKYPEYSQDKLKENLQSLELYLNCVISFSMIQACRGLLYNVIVGDKLMELDEFEGIIKRVISSHIEIRSDLDQSDYHYSNISIFGLFMNKQRTCLAPFSCVKGCNLQWMDCCCDGLAKYLIELSIHHNLQLQITGRSSQLDSYIKSVKYHRIKLISDPQQYSSLVDLRQIFHNNDMKYWSAISNDNQLSEVKTPQEIVVFQLASHHNELLTKLIHLLEFQKENGYIYIKSGHNQYRILSTKNLRFIIFTTNDEPTPFPLLMSQHLLQLNVIDAELPEAKSIIHKCLEKWIQHLPEVTRTVLKCFAEKLGHFIAESFYLIHHHNTNQIIEALPKSNLMDITEATLYSMLQSDQFQQTLAYQQNWTQIRAFMEILKGHKMHLFGQLVKQMEKKYPIESPRDNSDYQIYSTHKSLVRLIRFVLSEISRTVVDCQPQQASNISQLLSDTLVKCFCDSPTLSLTELTIKHFPVPIKLMTDIVAYPSRYCCPIATIIKREPFEKPCKSERGIFYQPLLEPHNFSIINQIESNIFNSPTILSYIESQPLLNIIHRQSFFIRDLLKIYRHLNCYNLHKACLFLELNSGLLNSNNYIFLISEIMQLKLITPASDFHNSNEEFIKQFKQAVLFSANIDQKVLFHIDIKNIEITEQIVNFFSELLHIKSTIGLFQLLKDDFLEEIIKTYNPESFIPPTSTKQFRAAKFLLNNVERNFKIVITGSNDDLKQNSFLYKLSVLFSSKNYWRLTLLDDSRDVYFQTIKKLGVIENLNCENKSDIVSNLIDNFIKYRDNFSSFSYDFHNAFALDNRILHMSSNLFAYQYETEISRKMARKQLVESAVNTVENSWKEVESMQQQKQNLLQEIMGLTEKIGQLSTEAKHLRTTYTNAVVECKEQEKMIDDLKSPLEEMKSKSNSEFNEVGSTYLSALETMRSLDYYCIEEIKSYYQPPQPVKEVVQTVFYLLGYSEDWDEIRSKMFQINLYEELLYFDKNHIENDKFEELQSRLRSSIMTSDYMNKISMATTSLVEWLQAVLKYCCLSREINPQLSKLLSCQDSVNLAQRELGKMKVRTDMMRQDLEEKIKLHKEMQEQKKHLAFQLKDLSYKINASSHYLSDLEHHNKQWKENIQVLNKEIENLPSNISSSVANSMYSSTIDNAYKNDDKYDGFDSIFPIIDANISYALLLKELLSPSERHSVYLTKIKTAYESISNIMKCDVKSALVLHCYNDCSGRTIELICQALCHRDCGIVNKLYNGDVTKVRTVLVNTDTDKINKDSVNDNLAQLLSSDHMVIVKGLDYIEQLPAILYELLYQTEDSLQSSQLMCANSRLILITEQPYSKLGLNGKYRSRHLHHIDVSDNRRDFRGYFTVRLGQLCQSHILGKLQDNASQLLNINQEEKRTEESLQNELDQPSASSPSGKMSPLDDKTSHKRLLNTDSEILSLHESQSTISKEYHCNIQYLNKYKPITQVICLLIDCLGIFPDFSSDSRCFHPTRVCSIQYLMEQVVEPSIKSSVTAGNVRDNADIEITEEFLIKLQSTLMLNIVRELAKLMNKHELIKALMRFSVEHLFDETTQPMLANTSVQDDHEANNSRKYSQMKEIFLRILIDDFQIEELLKYRKYSKDIEFINKKSQLLLVMLSQNVPTFDNLPDLIQSNESVWREYLQFSLITAKQVPTYQFHQQPSIIEKFVLWKVLKPHQTEEIIESCLLEVFGEDPLSNLSEVDNIDQLLINSSPHVPVLLMNQYNNQCFFSPLQLVERSFQRFFKKYPTSRLQMQTYQDVTYDELSKLAQEQIWLVITHMESHYWHSTMIDSRVNILINFLVNCHRIGQLNQHFRCIILAEVHANSEITEAILKHCNLRFVSSNYNLANCCQELDIVTPSATSDMGIDILNVLHSASTSPGDFSSSYVASANDYKLTRRILSSCKLPVEHTTQLIQLIYEKNFLKSSQFQSLFTILPDVFLSCLRSDTSIKSIQKLLGEKINQLRLQTVSEFDNLILNFDMSSQDVVLTDQRRLLSVKLQLESLLMRSASTRATNELEEEHQRFIQQSMHRDITDQLYHLLHMNGQLNDSSSNQKLVTITNDDAQQWFWQFLASNLLGINNAGFVVKLEELFSQFQ